MTKQHWNTRCIHHFLILCIAFLLLHAGTAMAASGTGDAMPTGGGYAASGQLSGVSYSTVIYDAANGLPVADTLCVQNTEDGYLWIGSYGGVIRYDGTKFNRISSDDGLTSARTIFQDHAGNIWFGTNDNGIVVMKGSEKTHYTHKDGLPSSSIRAFCEDASGNVYVGTTAGLLYIDPEGTVHTIRDEKLDQEHVLKLQTGKNGVLYGQTGNGLLFSVENQEITKIYDSTELGIEKITSFLVDPENEDFLYLGTDSGTLYTGHFGAKNGTLKQISIQPLTFAKWISYECGRVWISSENAFGYLDEYEHFHALPNASIRHGIEMLCSDYQGNLWFASSTQGLMKLVSNNFQDYTGTLNIPCTAVNALLEYGENLYVGTENGLTIMDSSGNRVENAITERIGSSKVRHLLADHSGNLWISVFTNDTGLLCIAPDHTIRDFSTRNGMPSNEILCCCEKTDGTIVVGTNGGIAYIQDQRIVKIYDASARLHNSVILSVAEAENGDIYAGTDGDGLYVISDSEIRHIGRNEGLTSDVITRIIKDNARNVYWILTSNSIEYMKDGTITPITGFPYQNNYDIRFGENQDLWVLSSLGIFRVNADAMLSDKIQDYELYTLTSGIPYSVTSGSYSFMKDDILFVAGREGVIKVNTSDLMAGVPYIKMDLDTIHSSEAGDIVKENGIYVIPASAGRITIVPSIMDYSLTDLTVKIYLEGLDEGTTESRGKLNFIEYTDLPYGKYNLHIQIFEKNSPRVVQEEIYTIIKEPYLLELPIIKVLLIALMALVTGFLVWFITNSTIIRKQYDAIRNAKDEADRANQAKTRFLANISHEIRTPLNTIMGMDEMILCEDATDVPKGYFMSIVNYALDIRNASETLLGLINDFLDLSRIESGKMHLIEQEYDLATVLRSIVTMVRQRSTEKELVFEVCIAEDLPKRLYGDSGKIKEIITNLLTNAVKYTKKGGFKLSVSMEKISSEICELHVSVRDSGIGIKEEDMDKLFTAYERLEEDKNSGIQGTGLGLNLSKRFAELLGGSLTCQSTYGEGSEFIFIVRQKIMDPAPLGVFKEHDEEAGGPYVPKFIAPDADVLVVDDNPMNLNVMKGLLKATRVFVTTASSGEECLTKIREHHYDIVFLDHMMPGMDGIETVEKIRETHPDLPVYVLTANSTTSEEYYRSKGFHGYLTKPIDIRTLETTIMKHLPEEIMKKPNEQDAVEDLHELPDKYAFLTSLDSISVDDGIRNSGGIQNFIFSLRMFLDTIEEQSNVIRKAFEEHDIRMYTVKVHALKSSARIIGATKLAELAASLEDAGNKEDLAKIEADTEQLLSMYLSFRNTLKPLNTSSEQNDEKPMIPEEELRDAYTALSEVIPQMDYDAVEMIVNQLLSYRLPEEEEAKIRHLRELLQHFDWDAMEAWILP